MRRSSVSSFGCAGVVDKDTAGPGSTWFLVEASGCSPGSCENDQAAVLIVYWSCSISCWRPASPSRASPRWSAGSGGFVTPEPSPARRHDRRRQPRQSFVGQRPHRGGGRVVELPESASPLIRPTRGPARRRRPTRRRSHDRRDTGWLGEFRGSPGHAAEVVTRRALSTRLRLVRASSAASRWRVRTFTRVSIALLVLFGAWRSWARAPADEPHPNAVEAVQSQRPSATGSQRSELDGSTVVVPPVTGLSGSYARDVLGSSGLRLGEIRLRRSVGPWGAVVSQSIDAGARVPRGTVIDLAVVRGSIPPCWPSSCGIPHGRSRRIIRAPT